MQIELKNSSRQTVNLSEITGKYIVLDFWASWCGPCKEAVPVMERLKNESDSDRFYFIGVNTDTEKSEGEVLRAARELGISYEIWLDNELKLSDAFQVEGIPALFILNSRGEIVFQQYGLNYTDYPKLKSFMNKIGKG